VFSAFAGGGGSCMGYALAGYRVTGACEIDGSMADLYKNNLGHRVWREPIQEFRQRNPLPREARDLDVLDGSPPCSSFSLIGKRDKYWGDKRYFREGQAEQLLDELFFEFVALAKVARPKIVIGENVQGMVIGKAKGYAKSVLAAFRDAGYDPQLFLLDSSLMGVPQRRRRVFFIARRSDLNLPPVSLEFTQTPIPCWTALQGCTLDGSRPLVGGLARIWHEHPDRGLPMESAVAKSQDIRRGTEGAFRGRTILAPHLPAPTITAVHRPGHWAEPRSVSDHELTRLTTFPEDYDYGKLNPIYVCGMSVPPRMMEALAREIRRQCLDQRTQADAA